MRKRINFTGRKKLASEHLEIRVQNPEGQKHPTFTATLDPASMAGLDKDAKVYVEPYVVSSSMRFDFGTVSQPKIPADTTLSELDRNESILFRVKVVDESGKVGRIGKLMPRICRNISKLFPGARADICAMECIYAL
jgi:hypothetical protein